MKSENVCLITFFVINSFFEILCNNINSDLTNNMLNNEGYNAVIEAQTEEATYPTTQIYGDCPCIGDCHWKCPVDDSKSIQNMFLLMASEVILGAAIIMGLSAIITLLLKVCSRSRYRNSQENANIQDEFGRTGIRASLTSLQQTVMTKLRDRPPRYETRHNYEYQRREMSSRIAVLNPGASIPPPSYETSDTNSASELPPAYTIAVEDTGGILNQSFSIDEATVVREAENPTSENGDITRNRTSDNTLHI